MSPKDRYVKDSFIDLRAIKTLRTEDTLVTEICSEFLCPDCNNLITVRPNNDEWELCSCGNIAYRIKFVLQVAVVKHGTNSH